MPEFTNEERNGRLRTTVTLQPGERVSFCRCQKSADLPFCDGTHKSCETTFGPLIVVVASSEKVESAK
ncbi:MAG: hypothetical protein OHK0031_06380 [Anaerolineales bacterium]